MNIFYSEQKRFEVISKFLPQELISSLFKASGSPQLKASAEHILWSSKVLCTSDRVLVQLALDLWCDGGELRLTDLFKLDPDRFDLVIEALKELGPKPSSLLSVLQDLMESCPDDLNIHEG